LLLGYYTPDGRLIYAGRAGTGMADRELERVWQKLQPLAVHKMPLAEVPPRGSRFGTPLVLSRVHWVRPEMVVEVSYLTWTEDGLLRQVVYLGEREDKPAAEVRRAPPWQPCAVSINGSGRAGPSVSRRRWGGRLTGEVPSRFDRSAPDSHAVMA
jgi:bifunctional non-homologous end joining protein LigD